MYRRSDGRWAGSLELSVPGSGKRRRKYVYGRTRAEARRKLDRLRLLRAQGVHALTDATTLTDFTRQWLTTTAPLTAKSRTVTQYRSLLEAHVLPEIGHLRLLDVSPRYVDHVMSTMVDKGLSVSTARQARRVLSSVLGAADRDGLVASNPVTKTRPPALKPGSTRRVQPRYTSDEVAALLRAVDEDQGGLGLLFGLYVCTGMRRGEALALRWDDIDQEAATASVTRQLLEVRITAGDGGSTVDLEYPAPKTEAGHRCVPLAPWVLERLPAHRLAQRELFLSLGLPWSGQTLVFTSAKGTPLWPSNVSDRWRRFVKHHGLRHIRLHDLRHTTAGVALESGAELAAITELLGHSSIAITKDIYATRVPAIARQAVDAFSAAVFPPEEQDRWGIGGVEP